MVGLQGFEPWTSSTRTRRSTKLSHSPCSATRKLGVAPEAVNEKLGPFFSRSANVTVLGGRASATLSAFHFMKTTRLLPVLCILLATQPAHARLGETEAQSQARYGAPQPELIGQNDKPLLPGAKEVAYNYQGWRVRAALVAGVTKRIEYAKLPENGVPKQLTEPEVLAVLDAEKGTFKWKEDKPRTGNEGLDALKKAFEGRKWERNDHARAKLVVNLLLVLETRDADEIEKKLAKTPAKGAATPAVVLPKF